jgi:hypothetical protein
VIPDLPLKVLEPRIRNVDMVRVARIVVLEGEGCHSSPFREVVYWYTDGGKLIARHDPSEGASA